MVGLPGIEKSEKAEKNCWSRQSQRKRDQAVDNLIGRVVAEPQHCEMHKGTSRRVAFPSRVIKSARRTGAWLHAVPSET